MSKPNNNVWRVFNVLFFFIGISITTHYWGHNFWWVILGVIVSLTALEEVKK